MLRTSRRHRSGLSRATAQASRTASAGMSKWQVWKPCLTCRTSWSACEPGSNLLRPSRRAMRIRWPSSWPTKRLRPDGGSLTIPPSATYTPARSGCRASREVVFDLLEKPLLGGLIFRRQGVTQLLQQFFLLAAEPGRNAYVDMHVEVAAGVAVDDRHALVADAELGPALGSLGDLELVRLLERGYFDLVA